MIFTRVDLPAPLSPMRPTTSPGLIVRLTWKEPEWRRIPSRRPAERGVTSFFPSLSLQAVRLGGISAPSLIKARDPVQCHLLLRLR